MNRTNWTVTSLYEQDKLFRLIPQLLPCSSDFCQELSSWQFSTWLGEPNVLLHMAFEICFAFWSSQMRTIRYEHLFKNNIRYEQIDLKIEWNQIPPHPTHIHTPIISCINNIYCCVQIYNFRVINACFRWSNVDGCSSKTEFSQLYLNALLWCFGSCSCPQREWEISTSS